ncbi:apolipoprotein L3-like [Dysidea avara]|uniref:apolipoprotein L3-like n=1 Tax=Dysidea avara TaxID=196820 RepID=UPI0033264E90
MDSLTVSAGTDSLVVDSVTLQSILSNDDQMKSFVDENSALLQQISLQLQDALLECEQTYKRVQTKLQQLEQKLPEVIEQAECIKNCIDQYHKNSTKATIAGSSTSLVGGALIIGGLLGAPFTFGASLGLTVTGAVMAGAGGMTTAGAKVFDYVQANKGNNKVKKMVEEVEVLCKEAQSEYEELQRCCEKLGDSALKVCPALYAETREEKITLGWNIFGLFRHPSSAATTTAISTGVGSKVALAFIHALGATLSGGESTTAMATFTSLAITMKTVGTVLVVGGIILDAITVGYAAHRLVNDKKCPTSEGIAQQIEELKSLQDKIKQVLTEPGC